MRLFAFFNKKLCKNANRHYANVNAWLSYF